MSYYKMLYYINISTYYNVFLFAMALYKHVYPFNNKYFNKHRHFFIIIIIYDNLPLGNKK